MTPHSATPHFEAPVLTDEREAHERHFGNITFESIRLNTILDFAQIRPEGNMQLGKLQESIDNDDLDNPLNIARLTRWELKAYIDFTNKVWRANRSIDEFDAHQDPEDGRYNLLVGGHRRLYSIRNIAEKHEIETGQATDYTILCKIMSDNSVGAIVAKQAAENLHRPVPQEREAMAAVELYQWGLGEQWHDPKSFYEANKDLVSRQLLREAMLFASLSTEIQTAVFQRDISYNAGLGLAKILPIVYDLFKSESELERDEVPDAATDAFLYASVNSKIQHMSAHIKRGKLNSTAALRYIEGAAAKFIKDIEARWGETAVDNELALFGSSKKAAPCMKSAVEQAEDIARREQKERDKALLALAEEPFQGAARFAILFTAGEVLSDIHSANVMLARYILSVTSDDEQPAIA